MGTNTVLGNLLTYLLMDLDCPLLVSYGGFHQFFGLKCPDSNIDRKNVGEMSTQT